MNNDLISRSALKAEVETLIGYSLSYEAYEAIINAIDNVPTVEAVPHFCPNCGADMRKSAN